jgi:dihydrofolate synthase/folylpolyglutamate synthase
MGGKDARGILEALTPHRSKMILARTKNDRAVDPVDLLPLAPDALVANDLEAALRLARGERRRGETILVTGSLFLVGEARALLTSGTGPGRG